MPCKQAQPGWRPQPDRSCLALGSEVARKAGKAKLFEFQGFPSWPGGRQPGRQQPVTACPTALESRQLLTGTIGQKGGTWASGILSKVKVQFGTGLYYQFKVHPSSQGATTPAEEARLAQGKFALKDSKCPAPWQGFSLACVFIPVPGISRQIWSYFSRSGRRLACGENPPNSSDFFHSGGGSWSVQRKGWVWKVAIICFP